MADPGVLVGSRSVFGRKIFDPDIYLNVMIVDDDLYILVIDKYYIYYIDIISAHFEPA